MSLHFEQPGWGEAVAEGPGGDGSGGAAGSGVQGRSAEEPSSSAHSRDGNGGSWLGEGSRQEWTDAAEGWVTARGEHLCGGRDLYSGEFAFRLCVPQSGDSASLGAQAAHGAGGSGHLRHAQQPAAAEPHGGLLDYCGEGGLELFEMRFVYTVQGPGKDYMASATYTRTRAT